MKKYLIEELGSGVYAAAIEDAGSWDTPTWANFYILRRRGKAVLIDAGLNEYRPEMEAILAQLGVVAGDVTHVLLTHGHHDHVEGTRAFPQATVYLHERDFPMVSPGLRSRFKTYTQIREHVFTAPDVPDLEVVWVNSHTAGSVVIYEPTAKAMFVGDFFCFFGEDLPEGRLVSYGAKSRRDSCEYVANQPKAEVRAFLPGLGRLLTYQPEFFCTGHGVILQGEIGPFLHSLWKSGQAGKPVYE